jgi:hypothetical protein
MIVHNVMNTTAPRILAVIRVVLTLTAAIMLGAMLVQDVDAKKNTGRKPTSIAARVKKEKQRCENNGGTIHVTHKPGSADSFCTGGQHDGRECTHTSKSTVCAPARTQAPQSPLNDVGGPPIDGGNEDPTGGGGGQPGGGAVPPSGGIDTGGGSADPVLE